MNSTRTEFTLSVAEPIQPPGMHTLVDHPDEEISTLARELSELESELTSSGPNRVQWPENITYKNFAVYQLIPTLVYELEYPRTDRCVATFVVF
jgi:sterol O-acyltransferase